MGRPKMTDKERRKQVALRLTPQEEAKIKEFADLNGKGFSNQMVALLHFALNVTPEEMEVLAARRELASARQALDAAIKGCLFELRDPTPEMIDAAARKAEEVGSGDFVAIWQAMIDAALK